MLNTLRSKQKSILWFLVIIITPAFIIWGAGSESGDQGAPGVAAKVNGDKIPYEEFYQSYSQAYERMVKFYENYYGMVTKDQKEAINDQAKNQALSQVINNHLLLQYADKNGFTVTAAEIKEALRQYDVFKTDGRFDEEKWNTWISNMPADRLAEIEEAFSKEILAQKAMDFMRESVIVTDQELEDYYLANNLRMSFSYASADINDFTAGITPNEEELRDYFQEKKENWRRPKKITLKYVALNPGNLTSHYTVDDQEARKFFDSHKEKYQRDEEVNVEYVKIRSSDYTDRVSVSEQEIRDYYRDNQDKFDQGRRIALQYALLRGEALSEEISITDNDIKAYYETHKEEFKVPSRARARHILFTLPVNPTEEEKKEIEAQAQEVLEKARAGEDFAALAKEYSQGPTGQAGGDLGYFKRGDMVEAFDKAVFEKMKVGEVYGPVETQYGFHIIKLEDREESHYPSPEESSVKTNITQTLREEKIASLLKVRAQEIEKMVEAGLSLQEIAETAGMDLRSLGLSTQSEIQQNVISDPEITSTLFSAPLNTVAGPFNTGDALLVARAVDASDNYILPLSDSRVRPRIIDQLKREKALALAEKAAAGYQKRLAEAGPENFRDRAKEMEMIPFQTGFFEPGYQSFVPGFGYDMNFKRAAFALKYGDISEPVQVPDGYVIMHLVERRSGYLPSFEEAKGRVVDDIKYSKALKDLRGAAKDVAKDARDGEISQEALAKYNLRVQTADAVNRENIPSFLQQIRDPAEQEKAIERIIKGREGDVLAPLMLGDTYFVMWLPQVKESFIPDLDEVKNEVMLAYVRDKAKDAAYEELLREPPVRMDNVIVSEKAGPFTSEDLKTISQAADEGSATIEKGNEIYYINNIRIDTTVVESMTEEERIKARENLHNEKFREFFYTWLENRRKESKIRVYIR